MKKLPIHDAIADIQQALHAGDDLVLQAPPGAGKTTVVPLSLLEQSWCTDKILVLEPRRMAARAAAERMAQTLGEKVGETVGYRIRQDTRVSAKTKIEVVTGGVLTRILQNDPSLEGYSLIIFDEFHERNLDSDLGLALALHGRHLFRGTEDPLKLLVMSATLHGQHISQLLNNAPIIVSEGRMFPVDVIYSGSAKLSSLVDQISPVILKALQKQQGSLLVFLPGKKEILALQSKLRHQVPSNVKIAPLYGSLSLTEQQTAIAPANDNQIKVVLSTDIAETSLTIDGVTVIIDSGYRKEPRFDPKTGLTRLQTVRISQASATQRAGRAGRVAPGVCYRVWSTEECLQAFSKAEIEQADLTPLALQMLSFGIDIESSGELNWLTPPPTSALNQAADLLVALGAVEEKQQRLLLTQHGNHIANFPAHPRLAHMMIIGAKSGLMEESATLAAALSEPGKPDNLSNDIETWNITTKHQHPWFRRVKRQAATFTPLINKIAAIHPQPNATPCGFLLALAYPDRIAKKRDRDATTFQTSIYQLSNGRSATLPKGTTLSQCSWICVAEIGGSTKASEDRIYTAAPLNPELLEQNLKKQVNIEDHVDWDEQQNRFISEKRWSVGNIVWKRQKSQKIDSSQKRKLISRLIRQKGLGVLSWDKDIQQWCARIELLRQQKSCQQQNLPPWPDVSQNGLLHSLETWLEPFVDKVTTLKNLEKLNIESLLSNLLPWPLPQKLDEWAPTHIKAPTGSRVAIDYSQSPPILAVKLQEMFGCEATPRVANGSIPLVVHLLSPARRPLQVTQDLAGFWRTSYQQVKKEMKGRYPKHPWPEDPLTAPPTRYTKNRGK